MRRIDLCCKLLAPALAGIILQYAGPFITTVIVAAWNIVAFFGEVGLLWMVYNLVPRMADKKLRTTSKSADVELDESMDVVSAKVYLEH